MVETWGSDLAETEESELAEHQESAKRRQIMEGAREVFLAQGFDAASMGEIARKAGVSKGTLYVYFDSKERLFEADVEDVLTRLGRRFVKFLCRPGAMSPLRTVIAILDRMPEIGREFYETGPAEGVTKLCHYLESQVAAGILTIEDCEVAAAQFLDSCVATILKPLLFNASDAPSDERIDHVVGIAVRTFLAAYRRVA
jgi:AcrR family transcriptional regulator